jgi:hypothetical protein
MNEKLRPRLGAQNWFLATSIAVIMLTGFSNGSLAKSQSEAPAVAVPEYGDNTAWGRYFRQLQDTVATSWYKEVIYNSFPNSFSRGVVIARYSITPEGKIIAGQIVSNSANRPSSAAVLRALRETWMQPFPRDLVARFPTGLTIEQSFRLNEYDPTNYGLASSYPQLLVRRSPEIGAASNLDLRKYLDLSIFRHQSRILQATSPTGSQIASR